MRKLLGLILLATTVFAALQNAVAQECGNVSIARMNWQSAALLAEVDRFILSEGYGCTVSLVDGDTLPTFKTMNADATPDVAPEMWINAVREELDAAVDEGRLVFGAKSLADGGVEGWWIPAFITEAHPEIRTVEDALAHPELFPDPDDPTKGAVHTCPPAWSCQISTDNLFKAYDAGAKGFKLVPSETGDDLRNSVVKSFEKQTGWIGYYWAPTSLLGQYDMVRLSFGVPHDKKEWDTCTAVANCENPKPNGWPNSLVYTVVTKQLRDSNSQAFDYLSRRSWDNKTVNDLLAWMDENKATPEQGARHFLESGDDIWMQWITIEAANRIGAALDG